ncbi:aminomethyl transferase family protein [candidate division KSB1 bacterium]|nr:aminomethyl transferase family protein [candidate division KSB1 bacterium]
MKTSVLFEKQKSLGAEFGEFRDWQLPKFYTSVKEEYSAAKKSVVLIDRSYFEQIRIFGNDHVDLLHRLSTNEVRTLKTDEGQINIFTNEKGRIVDRVMLFKFEEERRLLISAGNAKKITDWIEKYIFIEDAKTEILSNRGVISIFGPKSLEFLSKLFDVKFDDLLECHFKEIDWSNHMVQISRTDELGFRGFNLITEGNALSGLWDHLIDSGRRVGLKPMGEDAYETLRIESGWPVYSKDFDEEINPHETNMLPYVNFDKGCYIGQEVVARLDTYEKVQKHLMGIVLESETQPHEKDPIFMDDKEVGHITSVTHSFDLNKKIALGYVRTKFIEEGAKVQIRSSEKEISGRLVKLPFKI